MPRKRGKRSTAHHHPTSNKQKRLAKKKSEQAKRHRRFLQSINEADKEGGKPGSVRIAQEKRVESILSQGKKGSHKKR